VDFLKDMKAKLEEFEREAQRAMQEQQERQQALLQAKAEQGKQQSQRPSKQKESFPRGGGRQDPNPKKRRSRKPVDSDSCPVEEGRRDSVSSVAPSADFWILDDLEGRLDEAFLLQEVLGPPRCVRGWDA
jgi:hypothetical protein